MGSSPRALGPDTGSKQTALALRPLDLPSRWAWVSDSLALNQPDCPHFTNWETEAWKWEGVSQAIQWPQGGFASLSTHRPGLHACEKEDGDEAHLEELSLSKEGPEPEDTVQDNPGAAGAEEEQEEKRQQPRTPSPLVLEGTIKQSSPPLSPTTKVDQAAKTTIFSPLPIPKRPIPHASHKKT
uniref:Uncharacterized protein n=1 Tax=Piliocolobus tephrosceles TaxID=591936 RepID=A0A8C9HSH4_9PRIM